ncbi:uncharacterized protein LOC143361838 [Halictus rubicundus]|uniref:uncharacterized protein LOC143361838 n=1 Tax=Halictus rubicundus TaxID=77578 RepID=UPI0040354426
MEEFASIRMPITKHARIGDDWDAQPVDLSMYTTSSGFAKLPSEIVFEIFSYLNNDDLRAVKCVSYFFNQIASDPLLWRNYEVTFNKQATKEVLAELRRMSLLRKCSIIMRPDCDVILQHLSWTSRNLEELHIGNCTGTTFKLFLRSVNLINIVEKCHNLHTINIRQSRFLGLKFYRLLAGIGPRLRFVYTSATRLQYIEFIDHNHQIEEQDRKKLCMLCRDAKNWTPFSYIVKRKGDRVTTVLMNYQNYDVTLVNNEESACKLTIARVTSTTTTTTT